MIGWWLLLTFVSSIIQFLHGRTIGQVARKSMGRIVGGHSTTIDRNPWQVQLVVYGYTFKCGGSLLQTKKSRVQSDIVLTAAHCMGNQPHEYSVIVGSDQKLQGEQIPVKDFKTHEKYHSTEHMIHDIALIKLVRPVRFSSLVQGIQLPQKGQPTPPYPEHCKSTGFGLTKEGGQASQDLLEVRLPYLGKETCGNKFAWSNKYMVKGLAFCAGLEQGGYSTCQGDSGGPFVCVQQNNKFRQYGVVSWGYGCGAAGSPAAFTNLAKYKTWIRYTARSM